MKKRGFALAGAILYAVATILFIPYFMFVIVQMILSFVGFAKLKKDTVKKSYVNTLYQMKKYVIPNIKQD